MTVLEKISVSTAASVRVDFVTLVRKKTTSEGHEIGKEQRNSWSLALTCTSLSPLHAGSPVIVFVRLFLYKELQLMLLLQMHSN